MQFKCWSVNGSEMPAGEVITITNHTEIIAVWEEIPVEVIKKLRGDINDNETIDARDYLLLKRAYFGTYTLTCDGAIADINNNGKMDARDYLLLKRMYFETYKLPEDLIYVS